MPARCPVQVYVDGSEKAGCAAWAFAVIAQDYDQGKSSLLVVHGDVLHPEQEHPGNVGEVTALQAEQCAVAWALLWIMQRLSTSDFPVACTICSDCKAAGQGAEGSMTPPKHHGYGTVFGEPMWAPRWLHTPAHQQHP